MDRHLIINKLYDLAEELNITILYAVEIGSRAYKVEHTNSDHDIGIIYKHTIDNYLKVNRPKEAFHLQLTESIEVHGWDIYKMSNLLLKSNSSLYEWLNSDIVYIENGEIIREIKARWIHSFSLLKLAMHYQQMAVRNLKLYNEREDNNSKLLFQSVRCYLVTNWIITKRTHPPIIFLELLKQNFEEEAQGWFQEIYRVKRMEQKLVLKVEKLHGYLDEKLNRMLPTIKQLQNDKIALADINELLLKELINHD
ncbi:DNA polymerase beta superfamily protein [Lottiidibacillus patelloidae]|nr:nucleotidyltransferase domain-containing protein [Lottiidibacillus patelloidae]